MRRALKFLGWTLTALTALTLGLIGVVLIAANTDGGRRLIERQLPGLTGDTVRISGLSGRFPDALRAGRVEVRDADGTWLTIEDVALDWHPVRLIGGTAVISRLAASHVAMARLPVSSPSTTEQSSGFSLPVRVTLHEFQVARLDVADAVAGAAASLQADGSGHLGSLDQGNVTLALKRLDGAGSYDFTGRLDRAAIQARLTAREPEGGLLSTLSTLPAIGPLALDAALDGPLESVATKLSLDAGPLRAQANGTVDLVHDAADLDVTARAPAMTPRPDLSWQSVALDAHVAGPFAGPRANGRLDVAVLGAAGTTIERITAKVEGNSDLAAVHAEASGIRIPGPHPDALGAAPLLVDATARMDAPDQPLTLAIRHPLIMADAIAHTAGPLRADGTVYLPDLSPLAGIGGLDLQGNTKLTLSAAQQDDTINVTADGPLAIAGGMAPLPRLIGDSGKIGLAGALKGSDVTLSRFQLDGRTLTVSGDGGMHADVLDLNWKASLSDLAVLASTLSGKLAAEGHVAGPADDLAVTADLTGEVASKGVPRGPITAKLEAQHVPNAPAGTLTAQGTLDGAPLDLAVAVRQDAAGAMQATISRADWKSAHAAGALTLDKGATLPTGKLDLRMARLDDLRGLTGQALTGSVTASLETTQKAGRQTAQLKAEARNAGLAGTASIGLATIGATVLDPTTKPVIDAKVAADGVAAQGMQGNARLELNGPEDALGIRLTAGVENLQGAPLNLTSTATLDVRGQKTTLSTFQAGWKGDTLKLLGPARVNFGSEMSVDRLRLGVRDATVDVTGRISPTLDLTAAVRNVTPDLARIVVPDISADGTLRADARLTGTPAQPVGTVRLEATGLRMRNGPGRALPPANLTASANFSGDSAQIDSRLAAGRLTTLTVTGRAPIQPGGPLNINANGTIDLALLNPLVAANGRQIRGQVTINGNATGTLTAPRIVGTAQLANGALQDFALGARARDITALIQASGDTIRIVRFDGRSGEGTFGLTGTVDPTAPGIPVDLRFTADNARFLDSDRLSVVLGANLTLQGALLTQMEAAGTVRISHAEIGIPERMPASIAVLNVRTIGEPPPPPPSPGPDIALKVTVTAPREIFVRGHGLFAELGGTVRLTGTVAKPQPIGAFHLIRGNFSIAGQTLTFTKGEVSFSGALADPSIDFVATSSNGSITANLEISGTASNPKFRLFSTPELPQDEVLAQLIFKRSASSLNPFELAQLATALGSLTGVTSGFGDPLESLRKGLGLDTLSVGGGTGNSGPSLRAGRYVAPGVFVGARQGTSANSTQGLVQVDLYRGLKFEGTVGTGTNTDPGATPEESAGSSVGLKYQFEY